MKNRKIIILVVLFVFLTSIAVFAQAQDKVKYDQNTAMLKEAWKDYAAKNYDSASTKFDSVSKNFPLWAEPYDGLGWCLYQKGQYLEAEKMFKKSLKAYPSYASSLNGLYYVSLWRYSKSNKAWGLYYKGKYDDAIKAFNEILSQPAEQYPPDEMWAVYDGLGWSYYWKKDYKSSEKNFSDALKALSNYADAQKGLGFIAYKNGNYEKAIEYLNKSAAYYYLDLSIKTTLAWSYYKSGDSKKAKDIFSYALQINPYYVTDENLIKLISKEKNWNTLHNDIGWGYYGLKEYNKAEKEFNEVLKADPKNDAALTGLGYVKYQQKKYDEAIKLLDKALAVNPKSFPVNEIVLVPGAYGQYYIISDGNTTMGWSYFYKNNFAKAEECFKRALKKNNWVDAHDGLGWTYLKLKKTDSAEKEFVRALKFYPTYASSLMGLGEINSKKYAESNKAWAQYFKGEFKKAIDQFKQVIAQKGSQYPKADIWALYSGMGWSNYFLKNYDDAVKGFQESIKMFPKSADSYDGLGWSFLKKGSSADAEKAFLSALKLYPNYYSSMKGLEELNKANKNK